MGYFYIDESIHDRAGFMLGAFVFSKNDLTPLVYKAIKSCGLKPGVDEFKSSTIMSKNPIRQVLRNRINKLLFNVKLGLVVVPSNERRNFGFEVLQGLNKIILCNELIGEKHHVYIDEGILFRDRAHMIENLELSNCCEIHVDQNSIIIGGLQVADLTAHSMSIMLLETLGIINKKVKAGIAFRL